MATTTNVDLKRIQDIAAEVFNASIGAISKNVADTKAHTEERDRIAAEIGGARMSIMRDMAKASSDNLWTFDEIKAGTALVPSKHNDQGDKKTLKSLQTMALEVSRAAHPLVRDRFNDLVVMVAEAWTIEKALAKNGATAYVIKLFKREYHALIATCKLVGDGVKVDSYDDLVNYARANDPDKDAGKVAEQITEMTDKLRETFQAFPVQAIESAVRYLEGVTKDVLTASVATPATTVVANVATPAHPFTPKQRKKGNAPAAAPVPDVSANIDNLTNDNLALQDAAN